MLYVRLLCVERKCIYALRAAVVRRKEVYLCWCSVKTAGSLSQGKSGHKENARGRPN